MALGDPPEDYKTHEKYAKSLFNLVWDLLDKECRTAADDERMVHAAHASRYHWGEIGTPLELARGEWQIARVYAVLGRANAALHHAKRSLALCQDNGIGDFDLAFAYEAVARAYAAAGDTARVRETLAQARQASEQIGDPDNLAYLEGELATIAL